MNNKNVIMIPVIPIIELMLQNNNICVKWEKFVKSKIAII